MASPDPDNTRALTQRSTSRMRPLSRIHFVTVLAGILVTAVFVMLNLPGQIVLRPEMDSQRLAEWYMDEKCQHGWPLTFVQRDHIELSGPPYYRLSLWRITEGVHEFRPLALLVDVAVAASVFTLVVVVVERRRRRTKRFQISLRSALLAMTGIAVACGLYSMQRSQHDAELRTLAAIGRTPPDFGFLSVQWNAGGPTWLRQLIGEDYFRAFDRVASIECDGSELPFVSRLRHVKALRMTDCEVSNNDLRLLEGLPELEAVNLSWTRTPENGDYDAKSRLTEIRLPRLPSLRGINLEETSFRGEGLEHLRTLEWLNAMHTQIDDDALAAVEQMPNLVALYLMYTEITDEGLRRLRSLEHLEELWIGGGPGGPITDRGIEHIAGLPRLRRLVLNGDISDASIPVLSRLRTLEYLNLNATDITSEGIEKLKQALPQCDIETRLP